MKTACALAASLGLSEDAIYRTERRALAKMLGTAQDRAARCGFDDALEWLLCPISELPDTEYRRLLSRSLADVLTPELAHDPRIQQAMREAVDEVLDGGGEDRGTRIED